MEWFSSYLENRKQRVLSWGYRVCLAINFRRSSSGIYPWANIILIFLNDIVKYIRNNIRLFADDTILYKVVHNIDLAASELNIDLESIKFCAKI